MDNIHSKWRSTNGWQTVDFKTRQNFGEAQVVAIANKLARIAWAVLFRGKAYEHSQVCAQA
jgi:hypothetical protein